MILSFFLIHGLGGLALLLPILSLALAADPAPEAEERPLWGKLRTRGHRVGFRSLWKYDYARLYDPPYGSNRDPDRVPGRPILINIWYPAARSAGARPMLYREYLEIATDDPPLNRFAQRLISFNRNMISEEVFWKPLDRLDPEERQRFEQLMQTPTAAFRDAAPRKGRFPLIVNHQGLGGSFEDNAVLFEFLASHGYVVVNSAYPSETALYLNIDGDLERSIKDMEFLVNAMHSWPNADLRRIGAIGQSYGGSAVMAWRSETNSPVGAVVSLDATIEYVPVGDPRLGRIKERLGKVRNMAAPMLLFAQKSRSPDFGHYAPLKYSERYYASASHLLHNDFISHGAIGSQIAPGSRSPTPDPRQIQPAYEQVCLYTLHFLQAYLKQEATALAFLQSGVEGNGPEADLLSLQYQPAAPLPPTARQLVDLALNHGTERALDLGRRFPEDLDEDTLRWANRILAEMGHAESALAMLRLNADLHPASAEACQSLAVAYVANGDREAALRTFGRALELAGTESERAEAAKEGLQTARLAPRLVLTVTDPHTPQLGWQPLPGARGYMVYRGAEGMPPEQFTKLTPEPSSQTTFTDPNLNRETDPAPIYAVTAIFPGSDGESRESPPITARAILGSAPPGWVGTSINEGASSGSVGFDPASGEITLRGSGADIWGEADGCYFLHRPLEGDFEITVEALTRPTDTDPWAKAGLMIREGLAPGARTAYLIVSPGNGLSFQWRPVAESGDANQWHVVIPDAELRVPITLRLTRRGDTLIPACSRDHGRSFQPAGDPLRLDPSLAKTLEVGLTITAHRAGQISEARFRTLSLHQ